MFAGIQRQEDAPPNKPTRRVRNRTTGFEDLPSQKRMAPKVPQEAGKLPLCRRTSLSDQDLRQIGSRDDHPVPPPRTRKHSDATDSSAEVATPLKSALKSREGSKKFDQDGRPRRPVRILAPRAPADEANINEQQQKSAAIFDNLEYLLTSDLKMDEKASLDSFYGNMESEESTASSPSADASVQCSLPFGHGVFDAVLQMNSRTLAAVGSCEPPQTVWWSEDTVWTELMDTEPCFCTKDAEFYKANDVAQHHNSVITMVSKQLITPFVMRHGKRY